MDSEFLNPARTLRAAALHEGMQVADLGSGSGFFTRAAARMVAPGEVWAVDAHQAMLPRLKALAAAEGLHNVEVVHGNIEKHGGSHLPASAFDLVIIANLLFSAEDKAAVAHEARRVLKKGGRALVVDWAGSFGGLGPHPEHVVSKEAAQKIFETAGFGAGEALPAGSYHWGLILRKKS